MDPLRPFATFIRSLRSAKRTSATARGTGPARSPDPPPHDAVAEPAPPQPIHLRLQPRLPSVTDWNSGRARELFVECVLLAELGDDLGRDPGFMSLVQRVSSYIATEPRVSERLDQLLKQLSGAAARP